MLDAEKISGYTEWATDAGIPFPKIMIYVGKISELIGGLWLTLG